MLIRGDARFLPLQGASIDCVITSPPYWNLREYPDSRQIGQEPTPTAYVEALVAVFRDVWRVLKPGGTVWLNLGDSYNSASQFNHHTPGGAVGTGDRYSEGSRAEWPGHRPRIDGLKIKDLVGIPWTVAFALRADGWFLRSDIIWAKPYCMPESVADRPTRVHEYLFLLAKQPSYYYDADAIREPLSDYYVEGLADLNGVKAERPRDMDNFSKERRRTKGIGNASTRRARTAFINPAGRNKRSVWTVNPEPYTGAHFATMPEALVVPCVLAGCPLGGRVLDPFVGSGTVVAVAQRLGRYGVGLDLAYQALAQERTAQRGLPFA